MNHLRTFFAGALGASLAAGLLAACSSTPVSDPTGQSTSALSYYRDVKSLVDAHCVSCHTEGGIAPFSLATFDEVYAMRDAVKSAVAGRRMPPWLAGPNCADYKDVRGLSDEDIATITGWVDAGATAGDPKATPAKVVPQRASTELSRADLRLELPVTYTPVAGSDGDYRCFILDWPEAADKYITGFAARPDQLGEVHHMTAYLVPPEKVDEYKALDDADAQPGYSCYGGAGGSPGSSTRLESWAPGRPGGDFPAGTGVKVRPGSKVVVQMHYATHHTTPTPDRSAIELRLDDRVEKDAAALYFTSVDWLKKGVMNIPKGEKSVVHKYTLDFSTVIGLYSGGAVKNGEPFLLHYVGYHMHTRGVRGRVWVEKQGQGEQCALDVPRWDFNWQLYYHFTEPRLIEPGDKIGIECEWNNEKGERDISWGEGTEDEMCVAILYVSRP